MISKIRSSRFSRYITVFLCLIFLNSIFTPQVFALTSGPTLPEVQSFEPIGTNQMVDVFSGSFTYNIPLFDLPGPNGGYPFNLAYHSGVGMDQEATWVGLGWSLNPGAIIKNVRGLPDDFNGDQITQELRIKQNETFGLEFGANIEIFGADLAKKNMSAGLDLNMRIYYNNYKGVGSGFGFNATVGSSKNSGIGLGLGGDIDSQGGAGVNAQISLSKTIGDADKNQKGSLGLGVGMSSNEGLGLMLNGSLSKTSEYEKKNKDKVSITSSIGGGSQLSFAAKSFAPAIEHEMTGYNLSGNFKVGGSVFGVFGSVNAGIFYNTEYVKNNIKSVPAYGYMNLQKPFQGRSKNYMLDFNREKDGLVTNSVPNLAIPLLTFDYYNVEGQGISGMFRPFRKDVGHIHDQQLTSKTNGGSIGIELPVKHYGGSASYNNTIEETSDLAGNMSGYDFVSSNAYFKMHGEQSSVDLDELDFIGKDEAVYIPIADDGNISQTKKELLNNKKELVAKISNYKPSSDQSRLPSMIESLPNSSSPAEYYYTELNYKTKAKTSAVDRFEKTLSDGSKKNIKDHIGSISVINSAGQRYQYSLPAYNLEQREYQYSVDAEAISNPCASEFPLSGDKINYNIQGTDEYFKKTETPPYAHSYLLSSVLGADYVDLTSNGPSDDDLGYWVKFNYVKLNNYGWRAPYKNGNYSPGLISFKEDDKASFIYGSKEIWHLATAETKTHIAEFIISEREDGKGAAEMNQTGNIQFNGNSYKLDEVKIYLKKDYYGSSNAVPIKTVHFAYSYELCPNVENNMVQGGGKLTLKKVWFTYQNNTSGELSPYIFSYDNNFPYDLNRYDRWGNFKGVGSECDRKNNPYVIQSDYEERSAEAGAWQLSTVKLPSGGSVTIDYESNDYAYVQHKVATQMMEIASLNNVSGGTKIFNRSWNKSSVNGNIDQRKIYFKLEHPITANSQEEADAIFKKQYIDGLGRRNGKDIEYQIYFKTKVKLRGTFSEYISGYADLDLTNGTEKFYGVVNENGAYSKGYITLKSYKIDRGKDKFYHPIAAAAWQFIRTTKPELLVEPGTISSSPATDKMAKARKAKSLLSVLGSIRAIFKDYTSTAFDNGWGSEIELGQAWIRLCSPDKKKYGGGSRVKQISINDNWKQQTGDSENDAIYGQAYNYTMEENGEIISSGVAAYEPMIGGDENPLRYAKKYSNNIPFKSDNQLYFEFPINESLYPAATIGYRKVTVHSLNSQFEANSGEPNTSKHRGAGVTEYEFYTYKDFPIISKETDIIKHPYDLYIPIPLIGSLEWHNLVATQGYVVELNDMNGKTKSIKNYAVAQNGMKGQLVGAVEYYYKQKSRSVDGEWVNQVDNKADILTAYGGNDGFTIAQREIGTEYDFFTDFRNNKTRAWQGGVNINVDLIIAGIFPIPIPVPWPSVSRSQKELKTVVTNKVIFRPGILERVVQTDGASVVTMKNLLFDETTGRPLLTTLVNNYNSPVYNLSVPAYKVVKSATEIYPGHIQLFMGTPIRYYYTLTSEYPEVLLNIDSGKEMILYWGDGMSANEARVTYIQKNENSYIIASDTELPSSQDVNVRVPSLGKRIDLSLDAISISALENPTQNLAQQAYSASIDAPDISGDNIISKNISGSYYTINNVINAGFVAYSDLWHRNFSGIPNRDQTDHTMWVPYRSYVLQAGRTQSPNLKLATDGVMNNVPLLNLSDPFFHIGKPEWKLPEEITRINEEGRLIESRDILGNFSSALYGYSGAEVTMVAGNANTSEIGYEGFEDILSNQFDAPNLFLFSKNNLAFSTSNISKNLIKQYPVLVGNGKIAVLDGPFDPSINYSPAKVYASLTKNQYYESGNVIQYCSNITAKPSVGKYSGKTTISLNDADLSVFTNDRIWKGTFVFSETAIINATSSVIEAGGHTGKYALLSNGSECMQPLLKLKPDRKYVLDFWMKGDVFNSSQINFYNSQNNLLQTFAVTAIHKVGKKVEGWQRVQAIFTMPVDAKLFSLKFPVATYIDDIRIFPSDGSVKTFVYNPDNLKLAAALDENNYATLYYYDEEGNLFLIKKETEEGIKTIQESRAHLPQ